MEYRRTQPRPEKVAIVQEIEQLLQEAQSLLLVEMHGLSVPEVSELRRAFREAGVRYKVYKNTLLNIAARHFGLEGLEPYLHGPTAVAASFQDPGAAMRVLRDFLRTHPDYHIRVKGAIVAQSVYDAASAEALADLPTYEQAVALLAGTLRAPIRRLATGCQGPVQKLHGTLNALRSELAWALQRVVDKKQQAEAA